MMPTPPATTTVHAPDPMDVAAAPDVPDMEQLAGGPVRRSSSDGDSRQTGSSDDYSDTGSSSGSQDDGYSDDESLADRQARGSKRAAGPPDQSQPAKRRRSSSDGGDGDDGDDGDGDGSSRSRKRRNLFPAIRRSQRCGKCHTCLNPQLKKACMTVRERMMKEMAGPSSSSSSKAQRAAKAAAGAGPQQQQQPLGALSPSGSADLDQDKYVDMLTPLIDRSGGLIDAGSVAPFVQVMGSFKSTQSRVLPTAVLNITKPSVLSEFMAAGGVDLLASWLLEAEGEDSEHAKVLLVDVLKLLQKLPVTKAFVSATRSARVIGSLRKHRDPDVQQLAQQVVKQWMKVIPGKASNSGGAKAGGSAAKSAGGASAAGGASLQAKKATAQGAAAVNGAGRPGATQVHMISDNDLFKPAAATKPKTSLRLGMGQPKRTGGVQLVDATEAGKLLTGTARSASAAAGTKLLPSQRPRLPSPPLPVAATPAAGAGGARVAVDLQVTPEQTVTVTLRVIQTSGRLPGLRRTGFGSSLGPRTLGAAAAAGGGGSSAAAAAAEAAAAAAAAAEKKPRKPRKRVSWRSERELESVRWFVKEDPAVKAREDAFLTEEQLRALAAQQRHPDFSSLIMMEHQHEKIALEAHHREEEERRRAALHAMQPGCPWHGTPPALPLATEWQVAFGEDSAEAQRSQRPILEVLHLMNTTPYQQPYESPELQQPPRSTFNMAHHDPNVKLIPLLGAQQQQQVVLPVPVSLPVQQPFGAQPMLVQVVPSQAQQQQQLPQQQQPVTYTLGQVPPSQPQLVMQPLQQPPQQPQQQFAPPPASAGPASGGSDASQLMQVLQSLSQSGLLAGQQQQQPQPMVSQVQLQQPPPQAQQLVMQPLQGVVPPPGLPPAGVPAGQVVMLNGMQVMLPPGVTPLARQPPPLAAPPGQPPLQLPPGFQLAPPHQQPPGGPPVVVYAGQPGIAPPGPPGPHGDDFGPPPGPWGGPGHPPLGPSGLYEGRGGGRGEGPGGPQRHGRGGSRGGGPYHREHSPRGGGGAPWQGNVRVCKFFNSARGCSKGDVCDFRHLMPGSDRDVRDQ